LGLVVSDRGKKFYNIDTRMKLFLDDENAVHKLVASQYKIAPDKLMRTGNYSGQCKYPNNL
jgi:hypothetical protein